MASQNISITLDAALLAQLNALVEEAERNRSWVIAKALKCYLEELEDLHLARERLGDERLTPSQLRKAARV